MIYIWYSDENCGERPDNSVLLGSVTKHWVCGSNTIDVYSDDPENPEDLAKYKKMCDDASKHNNKDWPIWQ